MQKILLLLVTGVLLFGCIGTSPGDNFANYVPDDGAGAGSGSGNDGVESGASTGVTALTSQQVCALLSADEVKSACGLSGTVIVQPTEGSSECIYGTSVNGAADAVIPVLHLGVEQGSRITNDAEKQAVKAGATMGGAQILGENEISGADYSFRFGVASISTVLVAYKGERYVSLISTDVTGAGEPASVCSPQELVPLGQKVVGKV